MMTDRPIITHKKIIISKENVRICSIIEVLFRKNKMLVMTMIMMMIIIMMMMSLLTINSTIYHHKYNTNLLSKMKIIATGMITNTSTRHMIKLKLSIIVQRSRSNSVKLIVLMQVKTTKVKVSRNKMQANKSIS